jgi:hypothetical protein
MHQSIPNAKPPTQNANAGARKVLREREAERGRRRELLSDPQIRRRVQQAQDVAAERIERSARQAEREALGES